MRKVPAVRRKKETTGRWHRALKAELHGNGVQRGSAGAQSEKRDLLWPQCLPVPVMQGEITPEATGCGAGRVCAEANPVWVLVSSPNTTSGYLA